MNRRMFLAAVPVAIGSIALGRASLPESSDGAEAPLDQASGPAGLRPTFPAWVATPRATVTLRPLPSALASLATNSFLAVAGAHYGQAFALAPGDFNPNLRGPDTDAGACLSLNPTSPGVFADNPITFFPLIPDATTSGREYQFGTLRTKHLNRTFTDKNGRTAAIMAENGGQVPHLYVDAGSGWAWFVACTFKGGKVLGLTGADRPHVGLFNVLKADGCLFEDVRQIICRTVEISDCYHRNIWDQQYQCVAGTGNRIVDTLFFGAAGEAPGAHVDYIHLSGPIDADSRNFDLVQQCFFIKGATPSKFEAIPIQHTDMRGGSGGPCVFGTIYQNNISISGLRDALTMARVRDGHIRYNTCITDQTDFEPTERPGIHLEDCLGINCHHNILEQVLDVTQASETPLGNNRYENNLWIDRSIQRGRSHYSGHVSYAASEVFIDPAFGEVAYSGIDLADPKAIKREYRRRFRPKADGPARMPDGTYAGALFPDGSYNDGSVFAAA